jgi:hypothetical protein
MRICYGWGRKTLNLSREQRYREETLMDLLRPYLAVYSMANPLLRVPIWAQLEDEYVRLQSDCEMRLACRLASIHHNGAVSRAPLDDGWFEETARMESEAEVRTSTSEDGDGSDTEMQGDYVRVRPPNQG